ncbi:MAG TPA: hypothetical protein VN066_07195 [Rhodocyclaceae bacterium]|jgi:hypothetical protein|nr:hypothetical protein [Rhodocyclaceae bacterium]
MKTIALIFSLAVCALPAHAAKPVTQSEAEAFFKRLQTWNTSFDSRYPELYSPDAKVTGLHYRDDNDLTVSGAQWQQILSLTAARAKKRNDSSIFRNIHYVPLGERMKITADRYMTRKCNTDKSYYMVLGRQSDGQLLIEEETFDVGLDNLCK